MKDFGYLTDFCKATRDVHSGVTTAALFRRTVQRF
jgi:hypothetical protein